MNSDNYKVVFSGQALPGAELSTVKANVQSLFQLSDEKTERLFSGQPKILKSGLTQAQAKQYQQRLNDAGAEVEVISVAAETPPYESDEPNSAPTLAAGPDFETTEPQPMQQAEPESSGEIREAGFEFTGRGGEYFKIWIVNILLTIITFGIYSAWATVRNNQYFYGNTQLDGSSFQYLAKPMTILKGRLIALAVFTVYAVLSEMFVEAALAFAILFIPAVPWILIKSLKFNAVNSAYRNVRFDFEGRYGQAFMVAFIWPFLNLFTLLLLTPLVMKKTHEFVANGSRYGTSEFKLGATTGEYYRFFGIALLIALGGAAGAFVAQQIGLQILVVVIGAVTYLALAGYFIAGIANLFLNSVQLREHSFQSDLQPMQMLWIYVSNSFLVAISLGLLYPYAKCRMAKYRASRTSMIIDGNLDSFVAAEENRTSALGQELGDAFDVGFAGI